MLPAHLSTFPIALNLVLAALCLCRLPLPVVGSARWGHSGTGGWACVGWDSALHTRKSNAVLLGAGGVLMDKPFIPEVWVTSQHPSPVQGLAPIRGASLLLPLESQVNDGQRAAAWAHSPAFQQSPHASWLLVHS